MSPLPTAITIVTRESRLALWQAHHVQSCLQAQGLQVAVLGMTTRGDQILDRSLSKVGGKGLFVKELETALLDGRADVAVHSLKDVPMDLPEGLELRCVMEREDPRDAWVSPHFASVQDLPLGAVVGTSSLRRQALLTALRPDLRIEPLRGNLDTRLRKLDDGAYDGIVLAASGLKRLGYTDRIRSVFSIDEMLPAAGQGALGLETRRPGDDVRLAGALQALHHQPTYLCVLAERAVSRTMGGSCSMPLAAYAQWQQGQGQTTQSVLHLQAAYWSEGVNRLLRCEMSAAVDSVQAAESLGQAVALDLRKAEETAE